MLAHSEVVIWQPATFNWEAQVAFLAAMVGPKVAAAAAQRALEVLAEEDPAVAAEAGALHQDTAQDGQPSPDRSAAPGLHPTCLLAHMHHAMH